MVTDGVTHVLQEKGWPEADVMAVELALQEAVANAIRHGCRGDPSQQLQCSVSFGEAGEVVITVRDPGAGFDPSKVANPLDPAESPEVQRPRHLPDQRADGRSAVRRRRARAADDEAQGLRSRAAGSSARRLGAPCSRFRCSTPL